MAIPTITDVKSNNTSLLIERKDRSTTVIDSNIYFTHRIINTTFHIEIDDDQIEEY